jgi:hypothetical protein
VAPLLGITDSYLRLVESGKATLNNALAFDIVRAIGDPLVSSPDVSSISFPRLALFMVGIQWVGAEMTRHEPEQAALRAFEALAERDTDFERFYQHTKRYFDFEEGSPGQKDYLETTAHEIAEFLRSDLYARRDADVWNERLMPMRDLLELRTLVTEILMDLKESLHGRSFAYTSDVAAEWEARRASQFTAVRMVCSDATLIVNEGNLGKFDYRFLRNDEFRRMRLLFITSPNNERTTKDELIKLLNAGRDQKARQPKGVRLGPATEAEKAKIEVVLVSREEAAAHLECLNALRRREGGGDEIFDAYWSFEVNNGLEHGFVGWLNGQQEESTRNLKLRESLLKAETFDQLWTDVSAARQN